MAQETIVEEKSCLIPTFERNRYFFGKPMTVRDFEAEQQYLIGKSQLLNRLIHGTGILCGMQISNPKIADGKFTIEISEGAALDCCGNLIVVNRTEKVAVQGTLAEGRNYLFVKFSECVRQPIMATANVSSCEEVCCYNRIRETFEVFVTSDAPFAANASYTGSVKRSATPTPLPILGARVEALQAGIVQAETLTDSSGNFTLKINAGATPTQFDIRASATGFSDATKSNQPITSGPPTALSDFVLDTATETGPGGLCNSVTQSYFEKHSLICPRCSDPRVFLAVADISGETITIDADLDETRRVRSLVNSNPMLHDLLCDHFADFNNPHRTSAEQIRALQSINGVGNVAGKPFTANIELVSRDDTLGITKDPLNDNKKIDFKLGDNAVKPKHLNNDTINNLLASDGSISITPNVGPKSITIKTNPAGTVTSVAPAPVVGTTQKYAREDHVHDLANNVVTKAKLADEVINTLVDADGTIVIVRDLAAKQIRLRTVPATDVSSVGGAKTIGTSLKFAREDHVHNLAINDRAPNANGLLLLTAGQNISIVGKGPNELEISASVRQTSTVTTGVVMFEGVRGREIRTSPPIPHGLGDTKNYAIVLGRERQGDSERPVVSIGDLSQMDPSNPVLVASYEPGSTFVIGLRDMRGQEEKDPVSYFIRWWVIPSTDDLGTVRPELVDAGGKPIARNQPGDQPGGLIAPLDAVRTQVLSSPGQTMEELAKILRLQPADLEPLLDQLRAEGSITLANGKFS